MVRRPAQEKNNDLSSSREEANCSNSAPNDAPLPAIPRLDVLHEMPPDSLNAEELHEAVPSMRPPMSPQEKIAYWLGIAEYDLKSAKAMQRVSQYLHVGFMCQQVVEKALKAAIAKTGNVPPRTHNLSKLANLACLTEYMNEEQEQLLKELSPLNTEARYRSYKELVARGLNKHVCKEYIIQTEEMLKWIQEKLSQ